MRKLPLMGAAALLLILFGTPACAHKVKVFASVEGQSIAGYVYFPGGSRARDVTVELLGPENQKMGEAVTNDQGEFVIPAPYRVDYTISADLGDGHKALFKIQADELPESLPPLTGKPADGGKAESGDSPPKAETAQPDRSAPVTGLDETKLAAIIAREVSRQVTPLREQIDQYEEKTRLHDVLGGLGYIIGLMGIIFYLKGRKQRSDNSRKAP